MNYEESNDRILESIINTYRRGSEPYVLALDVMQKRKKKRLRPKTAKRRCVPVYMTMYRKKYGMSHHEAMAFLGVKCAGTVSDLHSSGLLEMCIAKIKLKQT